MRIQKIGISSEHYLALVEISKKMLMKSTGMAVERLIEDFILRACGELGHFCEGCYGEKNYKIQSESRNRS